MVRLSSEQVRSNSPEEGAVLLGGVQRISSSSGDVDDGGEAMNGSATELVEQADGWAEAAGGGEQ